MEQSNEREREAKRAQELSQAVAKGGKADQQTASAANAKAKAKSAASAA